MPIVRIRTIRGALTKEMKEKLHKKISDVLVEIEGKGNESFRQFVIVAIDEEEIENFSMGGIQASRELLEEITKAG